MIVQTARDKNPPLVVATTGEKTMKSALKTLMTVALLGTMFGLAACNTTKGLGKDVENAGEAVQDAAD